MFNKAQVRSSSYVAYMPPTTPTRMLPAVHGGNISRPVQVDCRPLLIDPALLKQGCFVAQPTMLALM